MIKVKCKNCPKEYQTFKSTANRKVFCSRSCHVESKSKKMIGNKYSKGSPAGENAHNWKGDKASYWGIHKWISRLMGQPKSCDECGTKKAKCFDWANISHSYKRDIKDWRRLCRKCHIAFDKNYSLTTIS